MRGQRSLTDPSWLRGSDPGIWGGVVDRAPTYRLGPSPPQSWQGSRPISKRRENKSSYNTQKIYTLSLSSSSLPAHLSGCEKSFSLWLTLLCHYIAKLKNGRLRALGTPKRLFVPHINCPIDVMKDEGRKSVNLVLVSCPHTCFLFWRMHCAMGKHFSSWLQQCSWPTLPWPCIFLYRYRWRNAPSRQSQFPPFHEPKPHISFWHPSQTLPCATWYWPLSTSYVYSDVWKSVFRFQYWGSQHFPTSGPLVLQPNPLPARVYFGGPKLQCAQQLGVPKD